MKQELRLKLFSGLAYGRRSISGYKPGYKKEPRFARGSEV